MEEEDGRPCRGGPETTFSWHTPVGYSRRCPPSTTTSSAPARSAAPDKGMDMGMDSPIDGLP